MYTDLSSGDLARSTNTWPEPGFDTNGRPGRPSGSLGDTDFVRAGTSIYMQDDRAHYLYHLVGGQVSTHLIMENGNRRITGFLSDGDYFGSIFSDRYRYSAEAITDCTLIRYNRRKWASSSTHGTFPSQIILDALLNERTTAEEHALLLGGVTTCAKVAGFLLYLSKRAASRGEAENPVSILMTRYDIADFLGTTPESVSRCLTKLNRSGTIEMHSPAKITLLDWQALSDIPRGF